MRALVARLDDEVDRAFDNLRGHRPVDRAFYAASELADFSLLWHLLAAARALGPRHDARYLARLSVLLGAESITVNWILKSLFRRTRPVHEGRHPHGLRQPLTSSFPSGHASAAFFAAALLAEGSRAAPAYYALALFIASSRVHVRIHHASDVLAGAAVGYGLGRLARRVWPLS